LETIGLVLTAALVGAAVIAAPELLLKTPAPQPRTEKAESVLAATL
jgi:hypothetical protein